MRRELKDTLTEILLSGSFSDCFDKTFTQETISAHVKDINDNHKLLWAFFESWKQANGY